MQAHLLFIYYLVRNHFKIFIFLRDLFLYTQKNRYSGVILSRYSAAISKILRNSEINILDITTKYLDITTQYIKWQSHS